jgi:hypothetical protein
LGKATSAFVSLPLAHQCRPAQRFAYRAAATSPKFCKDLDDWNVELLLVYVKNIAHFLEAFAPISIDLGLVAKRNNTRESSIIHQHN